MSVIENLRAEISQLEETAQNLDKQRAELGEQLLRKRKLVNAFELVSNDQLLYDNWLLAVSQTPRPAIQF
jgi:hypothetical protein